MLVIFLNALINNFIMIRCVLSERERDDVAICGALDDAIVVRDGT